MMKEITVHQPLRSTDVRDRNQKLVLRLLFQNGPMSQSQIVHLTGLKAPTVFRIFGKLEEERQIRLCEETDATAPKPSPDRKGRRPSYYCIVPDAAFAIGVDFSTAGAAVVLVNFVNAVIEHREQDFPQDIGREELLARLGELIGAVIGSSNIDPARLAGIGIGAPGIVNTETGVVVEYPRIEGLTGFPLRRHFESRFEVPVFVHNNASMIAASEHRYSAINHHESVLAVLVRGGVGGAFVNHGRIFLNGSTTALELGRTAVLELGRGTVRVATDATDLPSLETLVGEQPLMDLIRSQEEVASWEEVEDSVPDTRLAELISGPAASFAMAVRNTYHILHPDVVLVIARYPKLASVLAKAVRGAVPEVHVAPATYDPLKACHGATDLVYHNLFSDTVRVPAPASLAR